MKRRLSMGLALLLCIVGGLAFAPIVCAGSEWVTTLIYFNIADNDEFTVTLLGESAETSSDSGTAASQNIEFNSSTGNDGWHNATVIGGSTQDTTNAILQIDNTGNTNLQMNISINDTLNECVDLRYNTTYTAAPETDASDVGTTNITLDASYTPAESAINLFLFGNFTGCDTSDDDMVQLLIHGTAV